MTYSRSLHMPAASLHFGIVHEIFTLLVVFLFGEVLSFALLDIEFIHDLVVDLLCLFAVVLVFIVDIFQVVAERGAAYIVVVISNSTAAASSSECVLISVIITTVIATWSCWSRTRRSSSSEPPPLAVRTVALGVAVKVAGKSSGAAAQCSSYDRCNYWNGRIVVLVCCTWGRGARGRHRLLFLLAHTCWLW